MFASGGMYSTFTYLVLCVPHKNSVKVGHVIVGNSVAKQMEIQ